MVDNGISLCHSFSMWMFQQLYVFFHFYTISVHPLMILLQLDMQCHLLVLFILSWTGLFIIHSLRCNFLCYFHVEHTIILMRKWNALGSGNQTKVLCLQQRTIKIVLLLYIVLPIIWCFMGPLKSYMCMFSHYKL